MLEERPALEFSISAGPGRLINYGVTTDQIDFKSKFTRCFDEATGEPFVECQTLSVRPTTTACETGA